MYLSSRSLLAVSSKIFRLVRHADFGDSVVEIQVPSGIENFLARERPEFD